MNSPADRWVAKIFGRKIVAPESGAARSTDEQPAFPVARHERETLRLSVHAGIAQAKAAGAPLTTVERTLFFADAFDSYFRNGRFDGFLSQARSEDNFADYLKALRILGLLDLAALLEDGERRYTEIDRQNADLWGKETDENLTRSYFILSEDVSRQIDILNVDIEAVLEQYADANYPWATV